jgi:Macrocin-O-methyltransferase (TylF)
MTNINTDKFIHDTVSQEIYDSFNSFIFSRDKKLLGKLQSKQFFCERTRHVIGDIVELGVFKGTGMVAWLKTLEFADPVCKKVIGFDSFDFEELVKNINTRDKSTMSDLFERRKFNNKGYEITLLNILESIGYGTEKYELVVGDLFLTLHEFLTSRPGFRASIINFDLDLEEPTEHALELLWPRVSKGGILIFDEYGIHEWTESNAVDGFVEKHNLTLHKSPWSAPTAFIVKS